MTSKTRRRMVALLPVLIAGYLHAPEASARSPIGAIGSAMRRRMAGNGVQKEAAAQAARPKDVVILRSKHPEAAAHIDHAQRTGQPTILHLDKAGATKRRKEAINSVRLDRKPGKWQERDEYPPAMTREGGHNASVQFINRHDNRGAGKTMGAQTRGLPDGARIRVLVKD